MTRGSVGNREPEDPDATVTEPAAATESRKVRSGYDKQADLEKSPPEGSTARHRVADGPQRGQDVSRRARNDAAKPADAAGAQLPGGREGTDPQLVERLTANVLAQINSEHHLHLPLALPDAAELSNLRERDPEAHAVWLRLVEKRAEHDMWMERAPYELPAAVAKRGQMLGLIAVIAVLMLAAYCAYLGHRWLAGILTGIDIIGLAAVFSNSHNSGDENSKK